MLKALLLQYYAARVTAARFVHKFLKRLEQLAMLMYARSALQYSRVKASQWTTKSQSFQLQAGTVLIHSSPDFSAVSSDFKYSANPATTKKLKPKTKSAGKTRNTRRAAEPKAKQ